MLMQRVRSPFTLIELLVLAALAVLLTGCPQAMERPAPPANALEAVEQIKIGLDVAEAKVAQLTCKTFAPGGKCSEPGFRIDPDAAAKALQAAGTARTGLRMAVMIPAGGVGNCNGVTRTRAECIADQQRALDELQALLFPPAQ